MEKYRPQVLRLDRRTQCDGYAAMNFGESKGMTFARVLIFPHGKGRQWLASGRYAHVKDSAPGSRFGFATRHRLIPSKNDRVNLAPMVRA
jgi:DNA helicase II / ATP-dependent DNA helicase PcrA